MVMSASVILIRTQPLMTDLTAIDNIRVANQSNMERFYGIAIRRLVRKLDLRLLPFLIFLEISSFINRVSIGMCL
jgi:hypothetical protein